MTPRRCGAVLALVAVAVLVPGCAGRRGKADSERKAEYLGADAVYAKAQEELAKKNLRKARQTLEQVQYTAEDRARLEPLVRVGLADSMFYLGDDISLIEARAKYQDFVTLFGTHELAPYAGYQAGVCSLKQVRAPARDQSDTRIAIGDLRDVTRRWPDARFAQAASDGIAQAESNLAEHEYLIGRFYLRRKKYLAAADRFRYLNETYPRYAAKDKLFLNLGKAIYMSEGPSAAQTWFDRLFADYPDSDSAADGKNFLARQAPKPKKEDGKKSEPKAEPEPEPKAAPPVTPPPAAPTEDPPTGETPTTSAPGAGI